MTSVDNVENMPIKVRPATKKRSQIKAIAFRFKKNKLAVFGLVLLTVIFMISILADFVVDFDTAINQNMQVRLQPPSREHIFGTDQYGRDMFARIIHGSRVSLFVGLIHRYFPGNWCGYRFNSRLLWGKNRQCDHEIHGRAISHSSNFDGNIGCCCLGARNQKSLDCHDCVFYSKILKDCSLLHTIHIGARICRSG